MTSELKNTEAIILDAARTIFIRKGYAASRMQEIADSAGINKSLLHYYFRSKDQLFEAVFSKALESFIPGIRNILELDIPLDEKISRFVDTYIEILLQNPYLPAFVIHELNMNPGKFVGRIKGMGLNPAVILKDIGHQMQKESIRVIRPDHFMVNLLGLCIFPFIARPVIQGVFEKSDKDYDAFLKERKEQIIHFVMNAITKP